MKEILVERWDRWKKYLLNTGFDKRIDERSTLDTVIDERSSLFSGGVDTRIICWVLWSMSEVSVEHLDLGRKYLFSTWADGRSTWSALWSIKKNLLNTGIDERSTLCALRSIKEAPDEHRHQRKKYLLSPGVDKRSTCWALGSRKKVPVKSWNK